MKHTEYNFNSHGNQLFGQYWEPNTAKAVIVLVHGFAEHSGRYANFVVPKLVVEGYAVVTYDNFGHGKSEGKRGHCPSYDALLEVLQEVIAKSIALFPGKPIFLYGHSMGGNLVINHALRNNPEIKGVIASSPFLKLAFNPPKIKMAIGRFLLTIAPGITMNNEVNPKTISKDTTEVNKYIADPLVHNKISPMFSFPIIDAGQWAINNAQKLSIPMLIIHGTDDQLIDHKGSIAFAEKTSLAKLVLFEGGYHELHNDKERDEVMETLSNWLKTKL